MSAIKERPIIMSAPMILALLAGRKTQTRRAMKTQPQAVIVPGIGPMLAIQQPHSKNRWLWPNARDEVIASCPYGAPGDRLWVRETWGICNVMDPTEWDRAPLAGRTLERDMLEDCVEFKADWQTSEGAFWRPSIFMPRWASRITLEVTGVRVERLQAISEADAMAEGITHSTLNDPRVEYRHLWESIHGKGSWEYNPWVWAVHFRRVEDGV